MEKSKAVLRFIFSLLVLGGITCGLMWANCSDDKSRYTQTDDEEECRGGPSDVVHGDAVQWQDSMVNYPVKDEIVTFEGYLEMPNMTYLNGGTYLVNLREDAALDGRKIILQLYEGDCENTMEPLPDDYENDDLVIRDNAGNKIRHGEKMRVTAKVHDTRMLYIIFAKRIDKID